MDLISWSIAALRLKLYRPELQELFGMEHRERGSHARGMYPRQDTSHMGTSSVKQEEEADTRIIVEE